MGGAFAPLNLTLASGRRTLPTQSAETPHAPLPVNGALLLSRAHGTVQGVRHNDAVTPARALGRVPARFARVTLRVASRGDRSLPADHATLVSTR